MSCVVAVVEHQEGALRKVSGEVASEAVRQAQAAGAEAVAVALGPEAARAAAALGVFGIARAIAVTGDAVEGYSGEAYAKALCSVCRRLDADLLLFGATSFARDLMPRVSALLDTSPSSDTIAIWREGERFRARRPVYAGKALVTVEFTHRPAVASLRPNVFRPELGPERSVAVESVEAPAAPARCARLVERKASGAGRVELSEAEIVVSGGRGLENPETFARLIEPLAAALGAAVGASRAVVDAGWRPHSEQVGQTGKTVAPKLYVACAVSGAIQHLAGMRTSQTIVAINKDPEAPIFKLADYGIVGDVHEVLPALTQQLLAQKSE